ncbi:MAG: hypothetical protein N3D11_14710, partial [Candidatus Sumerlaeia bacterium]|nr:hypothetical protein [Candidatus Sumerlaeia bacterium]
MSNPQKTLRVRMRAEIHHLHERLAAIEAQLLELRARHRAGSAIRALLALAPQTARRIANSIESD